MENIKHLLCDPEDCFLEGWQAGWEVPETLTVSEWADKNRVLSKKSGSADGQWRTDRTPFLKEIMDCFSEHNKTQKIVFMKPTQVGGTEVLINAIGYVIDHNPGPIMLVQPTLDLAKRWSRQRFNDLCANTKPIKKLIKPVVAKDQGNTLLEKEFRDGYLIITGGNSSASLRSMPAQFVFLDEVDEFPEDLDGQGDTVALAERRATTYTYNRKIALVSSPTEKGFSRIEAAFEDSSQEHYHVPCPKCKNYQILNLDNLTDDGLYLCEYEDCGKFFDESHKSWILEKGKWVAKCPENPTRGFHLNGLYAPIGLGYSWEYIAKERIKTKHKPSLLKTFTNTIAGLPFESITTKLVAEDIQSNLCSDFDLREIPDGCLFLTAGVDVQKDRFAISIVGWGAGEKCFLIDWIELPADPVDPNSWDDLTKFLDRPFVNKFNVSLQLKFIGIDSGNWTHDVYNAVRNRQHYQWLAVKGSKKSDAIVLGKAKRKDVNSSGRTIKNGVSLFEIGTSSAKKVLVDRLQFDLDLENGLKEGDRRFYFAKNLDKNYFEQLTSEAYDLSKKKWILKPGFRNEALDTWVYAYAVAQHPTLRLSSLRKEDWDKLAAEIEPRKTKVQKKKPPENKKQVNSWVSKSDSWI